MTDWVHNDKVPQWTGQIPLSHLCQCSFLFGQIARLDEGTPTSKVLHLQINKSPRQPPDHLKWRPAGRPQNKWFNQLRNDSNSPTADFWKRAVCIDIMVQQRNNHRPLLAYDDDDDDDDADDDNASCHVHLSTTVVSTIASKKFNTRIWKC